MNDFFGFKTMVSTIIVKVVYILGVFNLFLGGIVAIFIPEEYGMPHNILIGIGIIVIGNLAWRLLCEGIILIFSIHESLQSIEKNLSGK